MKTLALIGPGTVSYGETLAGLLSANDLAEFVGEPTAGTNGNMNRTELPGGYYMLWTGMRTLHNDGTRFHGVGIRPTYPVRPTRRGIADGCDEVLDSARQVLAGR